MANDKYGVSEELFCKTWQESQSLEEVATRLAMDKPICSARACQYRQHGRGLKKFAKGPPAAARWKGSPLPPKDYDRDAVAKEMEQMIDQVNRELGHDR